ncbi:MAG: gamma-glutamyl-gamma-aminobutyrate hydrolase family protein [Deltaproteobacteria bacterium]|nr:gamma-glutamyl-gamma-aminobutyrate hydrolase family protein [Deltaproteobacteria bacterium]
MRSLSGPALDVLLLDNRDSFTFNLAQAFLELGCSVDVVDSGLVTASQIIGAREAGIGPRLVVIGPGPRGPAQLPALVELVQELDGAVPIFGVCLGLQVIARARGGLVDRARAPVHGKRDCITHDARGCFAGLPSPLWVMRYHSLVATAVPASLVVTAQDADGQVMAVRDAKAKVEGVQFHPESIGTAGGLELLRAVVVGAGVDVAPLPVRIGSVPPATSVGPGFGYVPASRRGDHEAA